MDPPVIPATPFEQLVQTVAGLVLKPTYMTAALALALLLWNRREPVLARLRWGLLLFFAGEAFCAADWLLGGSPWEVLEILHGLGMVAMGVLVPYALFELLDGRVWRFTDREVPCSAVRLCGRCWKREPAPCPAQRAFLFVIPAAGCLALLPLAAGLVPQHVTIVVFGTPVLHDTSLLQQIWQFRVLPAAALGLLAVSLGLAARGPAGVRRAVPWFLAGASALVFSLLRFLLLFAYRPMPVWTDFWEELTELLAVAGVAVALWLLARPLGLALPWRAVGRGPGAAPGGDGA